MYIKILDYLTLKVENPPLKFQEFLDSEFNILKKNELDLKEDIKIIFKDDMVVNLNSIILTPPIGCDQNGSFWFDENNNIVRLNFNDFEKGTLTLFCSKDFNPNFLNFLIIYVLSFKLVKFNGHFIHSSVIEYHGKVIMFPAWRHSGKTNLMLKFANEGAKIIADDSVFIFRNGEILPYLKTIHILYYNILNFPTLLKNIDVKTKNFFNYINNFRKNNYNQSSIINKLIPQIRTKISNETISLHKKNLKTIKVDYIFHLNRIIDESQNFIKIKKIQKNQLVTKISEMSKFELHYFYSAYNAHCLSGKDEVENFNKIDQTISSIYDDAFSNIGMLYELTVNKDIHYDECFKLVTNIIK